MKQYHRNPNPGDSWVCPEHGRDSLQMRRFRRGLRGPDGLFVVLPGERVLPEPSCLRHQRESEERRKILYGA